MVMAEPTYGSLDLGYQARSTENKTRKLLVMGIAGAFVVACVLFTVQFGGEEPSALLESPKDAKSKHWEFVQKQRTDGKKQASAKAQAASALQNIFRAMSGDFTTNPTLNRPDAAAGKKKFSLAEMEKEIHGLTTDKKINSKASLAAQEMETSELAQHARTAAVAAQLEFGESAAAEARNSGRTTAAKQDVKKATMALAQAKADIKSSELHIKTKTAELTSARDLETTAKANLHRARQALSQREADVAAAQALVKARQNEVHQVAAESKSKDQAGSLEIQQKTQELQDAVSVAKADLDATISAAKLDKKAGAAHKKGKKWAKAESLATESGALFEARKQLATAKRALSQGEEEEKATVNAQTAAADAKVAQAQARLKMAKDALGEAMDGVSTAKTTVVVKRAAVAKAEANVLQTQKQLLGAKDSVVRHKAMVSSARATLAKAIKHEATISKLSVATKARADDARRAANKLDKAADSLEHKARDLKKEETLKKISKEKQAEKAAKEKVKKARANLKQAIAAEHKVDPKKNK